MRHTLKLHAAWSRAGACAAAAVLLLGLAAVAGEAATEQPAAPPDKTPQAPAQDDKTKPPAPPQPDTVSDREEVIVIGGMPTPGRPVLPANETEFRFKLALTGEVVGFRWTDLPEEERRRVQKLYSLEVQGGKRVFGEKVTGWRLYLKSGKTVEGLPLPERARPGKVVLRTATAPVMEFPESDIERKESIECHESDFYSALEIYQKKMLATPPLDKDAPGHLAMAQWAAKIGLYSKSLEHLRMAAVIDPQMGERNKDFEAQLITDDAKQRVETLYTRMVTAKNANDFATAWYILDQLDRNFPNHEWKTRWEGQRKEIEAGMKTDIAKRVIQMSYTIAADLVTQRLGKKVRVDAKNNVVPSIPGKQVTTRHNHVFRGTLISGEAGADIVLQSGDKKVTIDAKEVMTVQDVDLSVSAKEVAQSYEELKEYVCDANRPDGLKMQMIAKISGLLKETEAKVKEIFDARKAVDAIYKDGQLVQTPIYTSSHDAFYGTGSWLREGSKPAPLTPFQTDQNPRLRQVRQRQTWQGRNNPQQNQPKLPDPDESPDTTDDPEIWWKFQRPETQYAVLMGMAAEKVFTGTAKEVGCPHCRSTGLIQVMGDGGNLEPHRCPQCRGMGIWFKVMYK